MCCPVCPSRSSRRRRWWCTALLTLRRWTTFSPNTASGRSKSIAQPWAHVRETALTNDSSFTREMYVRRTVQNYLTWQLIIDRVNSLSRRFKEARARYRKVRWAWRNKTAYAEIFQKQKLQVVCLRAVRLSTGPLWRMLGGESASVMSRAAWRTRLGLCTCMKPLLEKANKW